MTTTEANIETWADRLEARIRSCGHAVRAISYADVHALRSGRFVRAGTDQIGWGRTDTLWTVGGQ